MASKKKPQESGKAPKNEQPEWVRVVEGFLTAVTGAFTGSVRAQAEALAEDAEKRIARLMVVAFLGILGFVYATVALIEFLTAYFIPAPWSYLIVGLLLIVAALAYSKR